MDRPRIADLFCGAGGAAMGLHRVGFEVVGFDIKPQKNYPFEFHEQDAFDVDLSGFDAVWASPPCQAYSIMRNLPWLRHIKYPRLIDPTRELLQASGKLYIIENVMGAKLKAGWLCGTMFGKSFYRHRAFETDWFWLQPGHPKHQFSVRNGRNLGSRARDIAFGRVRYRRKNGMVFGFDQHGSNVGHAVGVNEARAAMDIEWMTREELSEAIPPAYSEFLGKQLLKVLED